MQQVTLIIDDERGRRYYIRPVQEARPVTRRTLRCRVAERGEWADLCRCEEGEDD